MYERLLDKNSQPSVEFVKDYLGEQSCALLTMFEELLNSSYQINKEMKFPFGSNYGWGYKYSHKTNHLCYAFFEAGAFTVTLQLGDNCAPKVQQMLPKLLSKTLNLWQNRYPCGKQGGWVHYRVLSETELEDVIQLVKAKKKPIGDSGGPAKTA